MVLPAPLSSMAEHTDKAAEIMFETFNVPALHVASQAELAMYASSLARLVEVRKALLQSETQSLSQRAAKQRAAHESTDLMPVLYVRLSCNACSEFACGQTVAAHTAQSGVS